MAERHEGVGSGGEASGLGRRGFLTTAAGTVVGTLAAGAALAHARPARFDPAHATPLGKQLGQPVAKGKARIQVKDGEPIRIAIIGCSGPGQGGMGAGHINAFTSINKQGKESIKIVALCDVNDINANYGAGLLKKAGVEDKVDLYRDYREVLAREDIHGVLIATPEHWHAQMGVDAVLAGKDTYLEKPMTLRLDEALRLREVVLANPDIRLQIGTQMTNLPKYHEARKVVEAGTIGAITSSQTSYCRNSKDGEWNYYKMNPELKPGQNIDWDAWCGPLGKMDWDPKLYARWRRFRKTSTGICGDLLVHVVTPMLVALGSAVGWPVRVVASGSHMVDKDMENHDSVQISVTFESGHQMVILGSTCNEVGVETLIRGNKGNIYLGGRHCVVRPERIWSDDLDEKTIECADIGNDQDMHRMKWLKCIRTREQPDSDVNQGGKVMVIMDLATRSMWENRAFGFDPKAMRVIEG